MSKKTTLIRVHPDFAKAVRINAPLNNMKIVDYTEKLASDLNCVNDDRRIIEKKLRDKNAPKYKFSF